MYVAFVLATGLALSSLPPQLHLASAAVETPAPTEAMAAPAETPAPVEVDKNGVIKRQFKPFTLDAFIDDLRNKRDFAVFSAKPGSPESLMQEPTLSVILQDPSLSDFSFYKLDMDTQMEDATKLYIEKPATLLIFRGGKEVSRTVRQIDPEVLSKLLLPHQEQQQNGQQSFDE